MLYLDIDTLRPDHLGCYGYERPTSPNIDRLASDGLRLTQVYASDTPCLPSRTALATGRFGIRNGVINHGGRRADPFTEGARRGRRSALASDSWASILRQTGMWCTTISTFAERHSAFHWNAGFNEVINLGTDGMETADQVTPVAIQWIRNRGRQESWFLHLHLWDPHAPYRTPADYGNPFEDQPRPGWITNDTVRRHRKLAGPHSAREVMGFGPPGRYREFPRQPEEINGRADVTAVFDGYDVGVHYADHHIGRLLNELADQGTLDETIVMVSSDHGENLGELGIYCDHQTADEYTHHLPAVLRGPGVAEGRTDDGLHYQFDVAASLAEMAGATVPESWDGRSFTASLTDGGSGSGRDHLILSAAAWATQRSVRFDRWLYIRTYHDAFHDYPTEMLFDLHADPHEERDVASEHPQIVHRAARLLLEWEAAQISRDPGHGDPLWTSIAEGGGYYVRGRLGSYLERLSDTGRAAAAERLARRHATGSG